MILGGLEVSLFSGLSPPSLFGIRAGFFVVIIHRGQQSSTVKS